MVDPEQKKLHEEILKTVVPSSLAEETRSFLGGSLRMRCCHGWGWTWHGELFNENAFTADDIEIFPESFVEFLVPRAGIYGSVRSPDPSHTFSQFLALVMTDGREFDFTRNVAHQWRFMFGSGGVDFERNWFPVLSCEHTIHGFGIIALNSTLLDRHAPRHDAG